MSPTHHDRHWAEHPAIPTGDALSFGDRAADALLSVMGSWAFVIAFLLTMAAWITLNTVHWFFHWDEQPYGELNLGLSCLAGLQGSIILIASKRQNAISAALAQHDRERAERIEAKLDQALTPKDTQ